MESMAIWGYKKIFQKTSIKVLTSIEKYSILSM